MEIQELIRCCIMRGGTSKGIFLLRNDLPGDESSRDRLIMRIFGAPDVREIDGLGGADALTSKLAIIGPSTRKDCDVDYLFGQVNMVAPMIDYVGNCGNISSAVGPFAIDEGFVDPVEPITRVRIHQVNTNRVIIAEVPVKGKKAEVEGNHSILGVPGTGAKIVLDFADSAGSITGRLLPTGNVTDVLHVPDEGDIEVSLVDAANPLVFVRAKDLGLKGNETPQDIDSDTRLLAKIEKIRSVAAEKIGLVGDWRKATHERPYVPFFAICAPPVAYKDWTTGRPVNEDSIDLSVRLLFMQKMHKAYPVTGSICTVAAGMIPGTIVNQVARPGVVERGELRIGHPAGIMIPTGRVEKKAGEFVLKRATVDRTARCLMKGYAFVPKSAVA
ncbi:MAG: PrpF domain-containing protein [Dehalococcoidales bacterium]|nr:PrpF domain-containing protein [Dehalococcoidales bacterium]